MYTRKQANTIFKFYKEGKISMTEKQVKYLFWECDKYQSILVDSETIRLCVKYLFEGNYKEAQCCVNDGLHTHEGLSYNGD